MRQFVAAAAAALFVVSMGAPAFAKEGTVKGELVDQMCYLKDKKAGSGHADCAVECAKSGQPVAVLTADGKLYTVTGALAANKNEKLVPHMTHQVEVTGDIGEKDGKMTIAGASLKMASK